MKFHKAKSNLNSESNTNSNYSNSNSNSNFKSKSNPNPNSKHTRKHKSSYLFDNDNSHLQSVHNDDSRRLPAMLNVAVKAAIAAGNLINKAANQLQYIDLQIETKNQNDFVTAVDKLSEKTIIDIIRKYYPSHNILAEESGEIIANNTNANTNSNEQENAEYLWIIDPLDGTTNFIHGLPNYAVSIAIRKDNSTVFAVIFDPNHNELFTATKGAGAFLNNRRIRVSKASHLNKSLIGTGFPYRDFSNMEQYLNIFQNLCRSSAGLRRPGAATLDLCNVACGRTDGFFEFGLKPWDIAAGSLIVAEAGGLVGDFLGNEDYLFKGDIIAANPKIFHELVQIISKNIKNIKNI